MLLAGFVFVVGGLAAYAANSVTFTYRHPQARDTRIVVDSRGARVDLDRVKQQVKAETGIDGLPRAAVPITDHDFGLMDPNTTGVYDFEIKNVGDAPLKLEQGPTSCKCTLSGLSDSELLPGQTGKVRLEWFTGRKVTHFEQTAVIYSNDPTQRHIALGVAGKVKMLIGFDQEQVVADRLEPGKPLTKEVLLYSQIWTKFEITGLTTALKGVTFAAEPVDSSDAADLRPTSIQRITLTIPGSLPQGDFSDTLYFEVQPLDPPGKPQTVPLPLHGNVLKRLAIYGQGIYGDGVVELGTIPRGIGKTLSLVMKVRDEQTDLKIGNLSVKPEFLKARITPHQSDAAAGLYDLVIEVPSSTAPCTYLGLPSGQITIDFDHPRIDDLKLEVQFAVAP